MGPLQTLPFLTNNEPVSKTSAISPRGQHGNFNSSPHLSFEAQVQEI